MDQLIGKLVRAVDDLELTKRTVIIFTGDNGSASSGILNGEPYPKAKDAKRIGECSLSLYAPHF